ncbi:MAG: DNA mismatch repair endonuclease MutL, partial [Pyrinomonadaceae bacterium]
MAEIKILPDNLINQIAAGEVVERPASVIKELVENSLDAGSKRIKVEIELGGRRLMRVTDDGKGMSRDDAVLAFERHATSKIATQEDLGKIETLGFRGEALASIASVARVELTTKQFDSGAATRVKIEGGRLIDVNEAARPKGTTIDVRDLFFNTPARRKFMRSQATENFHITNAVTHFALANPEVAFSLTNNGRETIAVSPAKGLRERAYQLFGNKLVESLLPVEGGREFVANLTGFVSAPKERRTNLDSQYFFINGRHVKDKIISRGVSEGFRSVLPHGVYPVAFLFLKIPLEEIDVNVHPAKTEVRFRRTEAVKEVIAEAIRNALKNSGVVNERQNAVSPIDEKSEPPENKRSDTAVNTDNNVPVTQSFEFEIPAESYDFESQAFARAKSYEQEAPVSAVSATRLSDVREQIDSLTPTTTTKSKPNEYAVLPPVDSAESIPKSIELKDVSASKITPIGQLHNSFIVAADDDGLL